MITKTTIQQLLLKLNVPGYVVSILGSIGTKMQDNTEFLMARRKRGFGNGNN